MVREITEILKQLGWTDGFRIPVSNEENKKLENLVEAKIKEKAQLVADLEEMDERLEALNRHKNNISNTLKENQKLLAASRQQVDNSQHATTLVHREHEGLTKELLNMKNMFYEKNNKVTAMEEEAQVIHMKVSKLKKLMSWDNEELMAWEELHNQKGGDVSLLQQFINEDTAQFKELEIKRMALKTEVDKEDGLAEEATTEVAMLEQVLDRVAQLYRQAYSDHLSLIRQWEHSVQAMHMKDKDINDTLNEILAVRAQGRVKMEELLEAKALDANLKNNNAETQAKAEETHKNLNILRNDDYKLQGDIHELESELAVLKRTLSGLGMQLKQQRSENAQTKHEVEERTNKVKALQSYIDELEKKLEEVEKNLWNASQRFKHMEELVQQEQHVQDCFLRDINRLQSIYFRTSQELQAVCDKERLQLAELQSVENKKLGVKGHIEKVEKELTKIRNSTYEMEFSEQKLRSRISHLLGETRSAEQEENLKKIEQLESSLKEKQAVLSLLTSQVNRLENDCRQISNMLASSAKEVEQLQWKRQDGLLLVEGGKKHLKASKAAHHESLVEHALLRVKVNQVERALKREGSQVFSLSKQRVEWESAMKERQLEINLHKEMMASSRKNLNEERSQLQTSLNQLQIRRAQLQNRYDIISSVLGKDEFGEFISPTLLKIKMAQEKIILQQDGDVLDAKIKKAEKEIEAMENTLKVVNTSNETYRKSLTMIDKEGPEGEELRRLEKEYYHAMVELRGLRDKKTQIETEIQELQTRLSRTQDQSSHDNLAAKELEEDSNSLRKELQEQELKLHRADSQLKRLVRELRSKSDSTMFGMEEKDIALRELIDQNQAALDLLAELAVRYIEAAPIISLHLKEKGINLPQPGQYLRGVSSNSTLSGASSARSGKSSNTSISSCTYARRRIFDPLYQPVGSYHGTLQTPAQLVFPLTEDTCCAPHSSVTLGSVSDTHSQSDTRGSLGSPIACFEGKASLRSAEVSYEAKSQTNSSLVEVHLPLSGSALTASTETSQSSLKLKSGSSLKQEPSKSSNSRKFGENCLQSLITVEAVQLSNDKPKTKRTNGASFTSSRSSSQASSHSSGVSKQGLPKISPSRRTQVSEGPLEENSDNNKDLIEGKEKDSF